MNATASTGRNRDRLWWLALIVICAGAALRLYKPGNNWFHMNSYFLIHPVRELIHHLVFPLYYDSIHSFGHYGPMLIYLLAPFFALVDSPYTFYIVLALADTAAIFLIYRAGKHHFGPVAGVLALLLYGGSYYALVVLRNGRVHGFIPLFSILLFLAACAAVCRKRHRAYLLAAFALAGLLQSHVCAFAAILVAPLCIVWDPKALVSRRFWAGIALMVFLFAPLGYYELRYGAEERAAGQSRDDAVGSVLANMCSVGDVAALVKRELHVSGYLSRECKARSPEAFQVHDVLAEVAGKFKGGYVVALIGGLLFNLVYAVVLVVKEGRSVEAFKRVYLAWWGLSSLAFLMLVFTLRHEHLVLANTGLILGLAAAAGTVVGWLGPRLRRAATGVFVAMAVLFGLLSGGLFAIEIDLVDRVPCAEFASYQFNEIPLDHKIEVARAMASNDALWADEVFTYNDGYDFEAFRYFVRVEGEKRGRSPFPGRERRRLAVIRVDEDWPFSGVTAIGELEVGHVRLTTVSTGIDAAGGRCTDEEPARGWAVPDFDDEGWDRFTMPYAAGLRREGESLYVRLPIHGRPEMSEKVTLVVKRSQCASLGVLYVNGAEISLAGIEGEEIGFGRLFVELGGVLEPGPNLIGLRFDFIDETCASNRFEMVEIYHGSRGGPSRKPSGITNADNQDQRLQHGRHGAAPGGGGFDLPHR